MRRHLSFLFLPLIVGCVVAAAPAPKKKTSTKSPTTKSAVKKTASKKTGSKKAGSKKVASGKKTVPSWRNTQRTPTAERYKEIQQALASKGYLGAEAPSGVWDNSSVAALKKFQADQNLEPSGKIDSLSLIALGLGPRREQVPGQP